MGLAGLGHDTGPDDLILENTEVVMHSEPPAVVISLCEHLIENLRSTVDSPVSTFQAETVIVDSSPNVTDNEDRPVSTFQVETVIADISPNDTDLVVRYCF